MDLSLSLGPRIAVFPILADVVEVKTGSWSTAHSSNECIRLNGWLRNCFAQLITPLDIDGIGQNGEDRNTLLDDCNHSETAIFWRSAMHQPERPERPNAKRPY